MASRTCWQCGTKSHMTLAADSYVLARSTEAGGYDFDFLVGFFTCDECQYPSMGMAGRSTSGRGQATDNDWLEGRTGRYEAQPQFVWQPIRPEGRSFVDVPEHIASAANEAYRCHSVGAYRGAGALARAVVEATAKDKGVTPGTLAAKIAEMERQQLLRPMVRETADEVRHMGNDVAHGDFVDPVEEEESSETLALMAEVLEEVYVAPARLDKRRTARLSKKQP